MSMPARQIDPRSVAVTRPHLARPTRRRLEPLRVVGPTERRTKSAAERVVRESLRTTIAPQVVEGLLEALEIESGAPIPPSGEPLEKFLHGPLAQALERTIGPVSTAFVMRELRVLLQEILPTRDGGATGERHSRVSEVRLRPNEDTMTGQLPPATIKATPVVMVVSRDGWLIGRMTRELDGVAAVCPVRDAWSLVQALDTPASRPPLVLYDCRKPELADLAVSAQAATRGPLVLWGTDSERDLPVHDREHTQIVTCSRVASPADLSALSRVILGIS
jgi:hypothetical protein